LVHPAQLPEAVTGAAQAREQVALIPEQGVDLESRIAQVEKQYLQAALRRCGGIRSRAAELLHMSYRSFRHYAKKYGI
jgi:two-component system response regulator PilR (NtrC family)